MVRNKYFFTSIMNIYIPENYKIYKYNPDIDDEDMGINILAEPLQKYSHKINVIKYTSIDDINKKKNVNSKIISRNLKARIRKSKRDLDKNLKAMDKRDMAYIQKNI